MTGRLVTVPWWVWREVTHRPHIRAYRSPSIISGNFLQCTIQGMGGDFTPLENSLREDFLPVLFHREEANIP